MVNADIQQARLDLPDVSGFILAGKILSAITIVVVLIVIANIWRRSSFPGVSYGSISLSHGRLRWLWFTIILGAFALGAAEDPIARFENTSEDAELLESAESTRQTSLSLPLPFYRYERQRVYADGELAVDNTLEGFLVPWSLLSALLAYLVLVVRWNPENRLALRILQGRRRRRARS
ncbi:MAG: hypothetical protein OEU54_04495 [Gemmatimonadota bacterium]|nr:hypothetical protein [Gemmatimonadota bacterium]